MELGIISIFGPCELESTSGVYSDGSASPNSDGATVEAEQGKMSSLSKSVNGTEPISTHVFVC